MRPGIWQIVLIVALALIIFGGGKLAGVGKALGTSVKDFKKEMKDMKEEDKAEKAAEAAKTTEENKEV